MLKNVNPAEIDRQDRERERSRICQSLLTLVRALQAEIRSAEHRLQRLRLRRDQVNTQLIQLRLQLQDSRDARSLQSRIRELEQQRAQYQENITSLNSRVIDFNRRLTSVRSDARRRRCYN